MRHHNKMIQIPLGLRDRILIAKNFSSENAYIIKILEANVPTMEQLKAINPYAVEQMNKERGGDMTVLTGAAPAAPIEVKGPEIPKRPFLPKHRPKAIIMSIAEWDLLYGDDEAKAQAAIDLAEFDAQGVRPYYAFRPESIKRQAEREAETAARWAAEEAAEALAKAAPAVQPPAKEDEPDDWC